MSKAFQIKFVWSKEYLNIFPLLKSSKSSSSQLNSHETDLIQPEYRIVQYALAQGTDRVKEEISS